MPGVGLKSALELVERGLAVILMEQTPFLGGQVAQLHRLAPFGETAGEVIADLAGAVLLLADAPAGDGALVLQGWPSRNLALIHCVGSRQIPGIHEEIAGGYLNAYCSRTCCSATRYTANLIRSKNPDL
jgi:heterodisulfide reductase subunit A-like polyferredoxin